MRAKHLLVIALLKIKGELRKGGLCELISNIIAFISLIFFYWSWKLNKIDCTILSAFSVLIAVGLITVALGIRAGIA